MAELPSPAEIRSAVRDVLNQTLRSDPGATGGARASQRDLVNEADVIAAHEKGGVLVVARGAIVTPLAHDAAERFRVEIRARTEPAGEEGAEPSPREQGGAVAIGSDHGGFRLKETVKRQLEALGLPVLDQGTTSEASCDYPDFAARVARAVSLGEARWGVFVDGAGIGGAIVLNKVPGVLAATCHDPKAAENARGHNAANVLCLGSGWVDADKARAVVDAFFGKGFEGGRHRKRVNKIRAVERAFAAWGAGAAELHRAPRAP